MNRFLCWLALAALLFSCCGASAAGEVPVETGAYSLPVDLSGGKVPAEDRYLSATLYSDPSIRVEITSGRMELEDGAVCDYWIADIVVSDASQLRTQPANSFEGLSGDMPMGRIVERVNAVVAMNGDYYAFSGYGLILRQGKVYLNRLRKGRDVLVIDEDGDFHGFYRPGNDEVPLTIDGKKAVNAFYFGPILYDHGRLCTDYNYTDIGAEDRSQRIALCQAGPLHYKIIACGYTDQYNKGMKLREFAQFLSTQDIVFAYNLDGGNSAGMFFHNKKVNTVTNADFRKLIDIIYFASAWEGDAK